MEISLSEPVALTFSLKYLVNFCKASGLSSTVKLCLSNEMPLLVEYSLASNSWLRFYLAPKVLHPHYSSFILFFFFSFFFGTLLFRLLTAWHRLGMRSSFKGQKSSGGALCRHFDEWHQNTP